MAVMKTLAYWRATNNNQQQLNTVNTFMHLSLESWKDLSDLQMKFGLIQHDYANFCRRHMSWLNYKIA